MSFTGVLAVQTSPKSRQFGDPNTTLLHRRHTCTRDCHACVSCFVLRAPQNLKIASRTSSGSTSIDTTLPSSRRVSQQSLRDAEHIRRPLEPESVANPGQVESDGGGGVVLADFRLPGARAARLWSASAHHRRTMGRRDRGDT